MATITRTLSTKVNGNKKSEILLRVNVNRNIRFRVKSGLFVDIDRFNDGGFVWPKANPKKREELKSIERTLIEIERRIIDYCDKDPKGATKDGVEKCVNPDKAARKITDTQQGQAAPESEINVLIDLCVQAKGVAAGTAKRYHVLARALNRFEMYKRLKGDKLFTLRVSEISEALKGEIKAFLENEPRIYALYPEIYDAIPAGSGRRAPIPEERGKNTLVSLYRHFVSFIKWCNANGYSKVSPDMGLTEIGGEIYGDPIFLTIAERNNIRDFDLSTNPHLEVQRDIFIFHCYVGCRVSDLLSLTSANIVDGWLNYIPQKTINKKAGTVRVPLEPRAVALIDKYKGKDRDGRLFPFISPQKYNAAIKAFFCLCGITRNVTRLNPKTKQPEQISISQIASSHMARRTFIGNLYKEIKDPNIIGAMSGHVEGSKAFARYRNIDDDVLRDAIKNL